MRFRLALLGDLLTNGLVVGMIGLAFFTTPGPSEVLAFLIVIGLLTIAQLSSSYIVAGFVANGKNRSIANKHFGRLVEVLTRMMAERDKSLYDHSKRVSELSEALARSYGLSSERVKLVRRAGLLHDIGKLSIPDSILQKETDLSREEYTRTKRHSEVGGDLLETYPGLKEIAVIVRHHHEHYNGTGYPAGLKGGKIPLESRIIAVADTVDVMRQGRPYRPSMSEKAIVEELRQCAGSQFDPRCVEVYVHLLTGKGDERVAVVNPIPSLLRRLPKIASLEEVSLSQAA